MFNYVEERSESTALSLTYHLTPWDEPIFEGNTAAIASIHVRVEKEAAPAFESFRNWCMQNHTKLVSCRLTQDHIVDLNVGFWKDGAFGLSG